MVNLDASSSNAGAVFESLKVRLDSEREEWRYRLMTIRSVSLSQAGLATSVGILHRLPRLTADFHERLSRRLRSPGDTQIQSRFR